MKKVSIIVPVFNVECYLRRCIASLTMQTYPHLEIILIDDGSTDSCPGICDEYARTSHKIKVFHTDNSGVSAARNLGLEHATGEYISFVDPDDYCEPDAIEHMVHCMESSHSELVYGHMYFSTEKGEYTPAASMEPGIYSIEETLIPHLFGRLGSSLWRGLFLRNIIERYHIRFDTRIRKAEDWLFYTEYLTHIKIEFISDKPIYHYYKNTSSISHVYIPPTEKSYTGGGVYYGQI